MADFTLDIDRELGFSLVTVIGEIRAGEISRFRNQVHQELRTQKVLWDMTEASWRKMASDELFAEAEDARRVDAEGRRTALVCSEGVEFGIGRMVEYYTEAQGFKGIFHVFKDVVTAKEWLFSTENAGLGYENLE